MALNIDGALIESNNNAVRVTANSTIGLQFDTSGLTTESNKPYFIAQGNTNTWVQFASGWQIINPANTIVNNGGHFNTTNGRFTAPVRGTYYFMAQQYCQHYPTVTNANYIHPLFWVNGSATARQASSTTSYRLYGKTYYSSTYSFEPYCETIIDLDAGDYVEYRPYANDTDLRYYTTRNMFSGFLIN
jgi:hypothetical protein